MNLTLSVDEKTIERARKVARGMNKSLDQLIGEYLEQLACTEDLERELEELERLSAEAQGHSQGWRFNREDVYDRP